MPKENSSARDGDPFLLLFRAITELGRLARPRKIIKMLVPYGLVRLYQKLMELRRNADFRQGQSEVLMEQAVDKVDPDDLTEEENQEFRVEISAAPSIPTKDYWLRAHRHLHPLNVVGDAGRARHLNLVISSLGRAQLFGGIATCTVIATVLAKALNLPLRIIARDDVVTQRQYRELMSTMGVDPWSEVSYYSDSSRDEVGRGGFPIFSSESDIFLASSWWTAAALRDSVQGRSVYHIIQEDELMFYQRGDDYLSCLNALNSPGGRYIINSKYLFEWFAEAYPKIHENGAMFEPVFSRNCGAVHEKKRTYSLFFYARLTNPRNLFWFGIGVLEKCFEQGVLDPRQWDVYLAGDDSIASIEFHGGKKAINLGIMGWDEYRAFLKGVDLGLCLIHTPHPGYPVFDVVSAGGVAVTNKLYTKNSFPCSSNIIASDLSEDEFLEAMKQGVALAKDEASREANYLNQNIPSSWEDSLRHVVDFVRNTEGGRAE